jgi:hypothetical protein
MKNRILSMTLCSFLIPLGMSAQNSTATALPAVPATKILAVGRLTGPRTPEVLKLLASKEVPATVHLYLNGKLDQWYSLVDGDGVVFILNVSTLQEAHTLLEALPLGQAKLMTFEYIPIGPLSPLATLLPHKGESEDKPGIKP